MKKKILFICPRFFNYEHDILTELQQNFDVEYWDERPNNNIIFKILLRLKFRLLIERKIKVYYEKLIYHINKKPFDYVFIINPEAANQHLFNKLKEKCLINNNNCKFLLYLWDSIHNKPNVNKLFKLFDKVSTFDCKDASTYNLNFIPLFYTPHFDIKNHSKRKIDYDLCFIGTAHSNRLQIFEKIISLAKEKNDISTFTFFYFHNCFLFFIKKLLRLSTTHQKVNFNALNKNEIVNIILASKIVIDIHHPSQNGLTMRTIESIGLNKKLITTNFNIKEYEFYDPKHIYIYDEKDTCLPEFFLKNELVQYKNRIDYSLKSWVHKNLDDL